MPTTYNGIGTHYYGKKNPQTRQGTCTHCGQAVVLTSHDTRLWFVVFFIPVIPLGRKRIVDQCPACTYHYALDLDKWETAKQLEISGSLDKFRANPTPDAAIEAHQRLVHFHQHAEAAEFRAMMQTKFADNAKVHAYLGAVLEHLGQWNEAEERYRRALELRPDLPEARVGVAEGFIRANRLDDARALLDFLEKPGASQLYSLAPLETLAHGFQAAGRHEEALQLFGLLIGALPAIADHTGFRKTVEKSEKALQKKVSLLPKRKFSWRRLWRGDGSASQAGQINLSWRGVAWVGIFLALGLLLAVLYNGYVRRHRTLYVVNASGRPATVQVRDVGQVTVRGGTETMTLPEGTHHAEIRVEGGPTEEVDFVVKSDFFGRWFDDPIWALNVRGAAIFVVTTAIYRRDAPPQKVDFRFGQTFEHFPAITHPFKELPQSMRMKSHETRTLTQLEIYPGDPSEVFNYLSSQGQIPEAWRLAEAQLRLHPDADDLVRSYVTSLQTRGAIDRAEKFLEAGLTNRPVAIEWHRAFQSLKVDRARDARLAAEYDAQLRAEPTNSALLYLRGRVTEDRAEARRFFERAVAMDPKNPYPLYAQGYDRGARGDWAGARALFQQAVALRPADGIFGHFYSLTRLALGEHLALETECREQLRKQPFQFSSAMLLCDVLVTSGRTNEAAQVVGAFERAGRGEGEGAAALTRFIRRRYLYELGDFAGLERESLPDRTPAGRAALFQAQLELGRVVEALQTRKAMGEDGPPDYGIVDLMISLAWELQGRSDEAHQWRERAATALAAGDKDHQRAGDMLRGSLPPTIEEVHSVVLPPDAKAIWLACLARRHPDRRAELTDAARRLNVDPSFPYHLVRRSLGP
jgi:tetratricopeptide (TPR) repeat protein